jgi:hypothetical protein
MSAFHPTLLLGCNGASGDCSISRNGSARIRDLLPQLTSATFKACMFERAGKTSHLAGTQEAQQLHEKDQDSRDPQQRCRDR